MKNAAKQKSYKVSESDFINLINAHEGILNKVTNLYADLREDRKDLKQEILLQWWKAIINFNYKSKVSTFLYKVALNAALNYNRKRRINHVNLDLAKNSTNVTQGDKVELLYLIIKALPPIDKMLITLHLDGYKNNEIAGIAGVSSNNLAVKLYRIKAIITKNLKANQNEH
jgi:RNA polymerase sigma-70 factor (ECF subfamily)